MGVTRMQIANRALILVVALLALGCPQEQAPGDRFPGGPSPITSLAIVSGDGDDANRETIIPVGDSLQLHATFDDRDVTALSEWVSGDRGVATVTQTGFVTTVAPGVTKISAAYDGNVGAFPITVVPPTRHALAVSVEGAGRVTSAPPGIACGTDCTAEYGTGTSIVLSAAPDPGAVFDGWGGDADCHDGAVTLDRDIACRAAFATQPTHALSIAFEGSGTGTVTLDPPGTTCATGCRTDYAAGTVVTMTAVPAGGATLDWRGHPDCDDGTVTMDADLTCIATFSTVTAVLDAPNVCAVGTPCRFSAEQSAGATLLRWDFGDGVRITTDDRVVRHTYAESLVEVGGTREVTVELTVEDAGGSRDVAAGRVEIRNPNLQAHVELVGGPGLITTFHTGDSSRGTTTFELVDGPPNVEFVPASSTTFNVVVPIGANGSQVTFRMIVRDDGSYAYPMTEGSVEVSFEVPLI